ncbi:MAG: DUF4255 domain-containing protein, partial [Bacteroidia bacterium]|nr:DUF4255 domain-containing protein [Bacteroidia bacterium]
MALDNLNLVTETLKRLIENCFKVSPAWPTPDTLPKISAMPPDKLKGDVVGIYLYHVSEDGHCKNLAPPGSEFPPVRYTPMGLNLFYLLTTHSDLNEDTGPNNEQLMITIAMKALHDFPIIDTSTGLTINEIDPVSGSTIPVFKTFFPSVLMGTDNRFRIELLPVTQAEAVSYWTAGSSPLRLAAYYRVSVIFIEPEESKSRPGRVLSFGVNTFVGSGPRIDGCRNTLSFTLPHKTQMNEIELRPAQVPFGQQVMFSGSGFGGGATKLLLRNAKWDSSLAVDSAWGLIFSGKGATITIRNTIPDAHGNPVPILP